MYYDPNSPELAGVKEVGTAAYRNIQQILTAGKMEQTPDWYQKLAQYTQQAATVLQKAPTTGQAITAGQKAVATQQSISTWVQNPLTWGAAILIAILLFKR